MLSIQINTMAMLLSEFDFLPIYRADLAGSRTLSFSVIFPKFTPLKVADLNFGCATFCALPSFGAVTTFSSHTTVSSHKVSVKDSDIDMCSAIYFLFDHNTNYCTIYLCPNTVLATVWLSPWRSYTIGLDCTPLLSSAVLLPGPTNSRDFYILGHLAASKR